MGSNRPEHIVEPPAREFASDYPTPPRVEQTSQRIRVVFGGTTIADTTRAWRVLETNHPPVYYVPPEDVLVEHLERTERQTICEFKGIAVYYTVAANGHGTTDAAWCYPDPTPGFAAIARHIAFYPQAMDECWVDDERAIPQPGGFYGGWITSRVAGPFKG